MEKRKFDISWIEEAPSSRAVPRHSVQLDDRESKRESVRVDDLLLSACRRNPERQLHVSALAKDAGVDFDVGLKGVLRLVARGLLDIQERDRVAGDHLVAVPRTQERATQPSRGSGE
jgi:hypothetical protein